MAARRGGLRSGALLAALLAVATARIGHADDPRGEARAHYAKGLELAGQNGYEGALREFKAAYAMSPQFAVLFNIGQAHIALGHTGEAIEALTRYLSDGGDRIAPARRVQVERQIAGLRSTLPHPEATSEAEAARANAAAAGAAAGEAIEAASEGSRAASARPGTLTVRCPEPGLKLLLDGKRIDLAASSRGVALGGGVHHLVLSAPGRRSTEESLEVQEGGAALVICEMLPAATAPPTVVPLQPIGAPVFTAVTTSPEPPTIHAKTVESYILGGLGVALGGTAIGVFLWNRDQYQDLQAEEKTLLPHPTATQFDQAVQYNADVDSLHRNSVLSVGLAMASVGLIAGGTSLYLYQRNRDAKAGRVDGPRMSAAVTPGGLVWSGSLVATMRRPTCSPIRFALLSAALFWPACYSLPHVDPGNRVIADFEEDTGDAGLVPTWNRFEPWFCSGITIQAQGSPDAGLGGEPRGGVDAGQPASPNGGPPVTCAVELGGYNGHALTAPFDLVTPDNSLAPGVQVATWTKSGTVDVTGFKQLLFTAQLGSTSSADLPAGTKLRVYLDCGSLNLFTEFSLNMFGASWTPLSVRLDALLSMPDLSQNQTQICLVNVDQIRFVVLFGSPAAGTEIAGRLQLDNIYLK